VQRFDERFELGSAEELNLVEQQDDSSLAFLGCLTQGEEHVSQVHRQVGMVGETFRRLDVQSC